MQPTWKTLAAKTIATAGTRVQITSSDIFADSVLITADSANTGKVYVGDSTVTSSNGEELIAGQSISLEGPTQRGTVQELLLSDIYVDTATNGNVVRIQYMARR